MKSFPHFYRLTGQTVEPVKDITEVAGMDCICPHVADDTIGNVRVSTVFLAVDHNLFGDKPILFETMIFGGPLDEYMWRYSTWEEATEGHRLACDQVRATNETLEAALWRVREAVRMLWDAIRGDWVSFRYRRWKWPTKKASS